LLEALAAGGAQASDYTVSMITTPPSTATGVTVRRATDPSGKDIDATKSSYSVTLKMKTVTYQGAAYNYFDAAKATRQ
jgi:hypothetical protein